MITPRSIFEEIRANDEAYRLFLSLGAKGEAQGGFENAQDRHPHARPGARAEDRPTRPG